MAERKLLEKDWKKQAEQLLYSDHPGITATKFLLAFVAVGGVAFMGAAVPGLLRLLDTFPESRRPKIKFTQAKVNNSLAYLKKEKLLKIIREKEGRMTVVLTTKGKKRVGVYSLDALEIKKPKQWDGKWRILMFDIPAKPHRNNSAREALRNKIKELGFYQIQKSAWVYPYECEEEILFIAEFFRVQEYIEVLVVERMLHDDLLRKKFPELCW